MSNASSPMAGALQSPPPKAGGTAAPVQPRLWPAAIIVVLIWAVLLIVPKIEVEALNDMVKFMAQFGAIALGTLLFLGWWVFFSRVSWKDAILVPLALVAIGVVVYLLGTETVGFSLMLTGVPWLLTAWEGWLLLTRSLSWPVRRVGILVAGVLALGYCALIRLDGLTGGFQTTINWRWSPTLEDKYMASRATNAATPAPTPVEQVQPVQQRPGDWPAFRGPERDGRAQGTHVATDWGRQPPRELWRKKVGPAWSSFVVVDDRVYTQEQRHEKEVVMCWRADTGAVVWEHEDNTRFAEPLAGPGPRATPTFADGKIYTLGGAGTLDSLDAATGKLLWSKDIAAESGRAKLEKSDRAPMWGYSSSPLVTHGLVVVFAGGPAKNPEADKALLAFDAITGELKWGAGKGGHSYASAQLSKLAGVEQIIIETDAGVLSYDPPTGKELWRFDWEFPDGQRCLQTAVIDGSDFLIGTAMNLGLKRVRVTRDGSTWTTKEVWATKGISPYFNDLVTHKGHIYGFDGKFFACVNLEDGKRRWRVRGYEAGQALLLADQDLLVVVSEQGEIALVAAVPDEHRELGRMRAIDGKTWNHPVVAHGRLYVRNGEEAVCFELPQQPDVAQNQK